MVNSESDFHENSFEKMKQNLDKLEIAMAIGFSMLGKLENGTKLLFEKCKPSDKLFELLY